MVYNFNKEDDDDWLRKSDKTLIFSYFQHIVKILVEVEQEEKENKGKVFRSKYLYVWETYIIAKQVYKQFHLSS